MYLYADVITVYRYPDELTRVLGFDWFMLCLQKHVHHSTVVRCVRMVTLLLRIPSQLARFREGVTNGAWLGETEHMLKNKGGTLLGESTTINGGAAATA